MRTVPLRLALAALVCLLLNGPAEAEPSTCSGHPEALGVSRVIEVDPTGGPRLGTLQYPSSIDLAPMEVVLTFDDGPRPKKTERILDVLDEYCVKATFFEIGQWVAAHPELTREVLARGHTVGSHSWSHPRNLGHLLVDKAEAEIDRGFEVLNDVSGGRAAPFFRYPGLNTSATLNAYLATRGDAIISCDVVSDDWRQISASEIVKRTLARVQRQGKGIILFHDTESATVEALPILLSELEKRGYRVAHMVPKPPVAEPAPIQSSAPAAQHQLPAIAAVRPAPGAKPAALP